MRRFPQELVDLVLDQVADSEQYGQAVARQLKARDALARVCRTSLPSSSIATCWLVCKQWLLRSRLHVFSSMTLSGSRLRSLLDLEAESSSLPLLSFVRDLFLIIPFFEDFTSKDIARLRSCLSLTHLQLRIPSSGNNSAVWDSFLGTHLPFLGTHCASLSSLTLSLNEYRPVSLCVIVDILACLPSLSTFRLEGRGCRIIGAEIPPSQSCPPRLQTLDIVVTEGADILFAWFLSLTAGPKIKSLTLDDWDAHPAAQSLVAYFQRFGSRLEFLSIWPHRASFNCHNTFVWIILIS